MGCLGLVEVNDHRHKKSGRMFWLVGIVKHPVELAAQFIRRADYVLANDVLRDEYDVEFGSPAQIGYCSSDPEDIIGKEQFDKCQEDYIQGFFDGLIGNFNLGWFGSFSKNPHVLGILDGADSAWRYAKDKENKNASDS